MKLNLLLITLFVLSSILGDKCCKKDEPNYIQLDTNFLSYCAFPVGSWWVYQEKITNKTDSFFVNLYEVSTETDKHINLDFYKLYYEIRTNDSVLMYGAQPYENNIFFFFEYLNSGNSTTNRFFYPIQLNASFDVGLKNEFDTINVLDKVYFNVKVFENIRHLGFDQIKTEYYSKNVGVIRRELFNGEIWELKNHFINR